MGQGGQLTALTDRERALFGKTVQYRSYSKDLVKALNTPFGYNLARYKNLSIEALFSKDAAPAVKGEAAHT